MIHVHADRLTDVVNAVAMRIQLGSHTCSLRLIPVHSQLQTSYASFASKAASLQAARGEANCGNAVCLNTMGITAVCHLWEPLPEGLRA